MKTLTPEQLHYAKHYNLAKLRGNHVFAAAILAVFLPHIRADGGDGSGMNPPEPPPIIWGPATTTEPPPAPTPEPEAK